MVKRYELAAQQWWKVEALLRGRNRDPGRSGADNHLFVNNVLWVLRPGADWHDLSERYGKRKTVHKRFTRRADAAVGERVSEHLIEAPDNSQVSLDSSLARTHQQAVTGKGSKGGIRLWGGPGAVRRRKSTSPRMPLADLCA